MFSAVSPGFLTVLLAGNLLLASAFAEESGVPPLPEAFCANGREIAESAGICIYNPLFADYGRQCLAKLDEITRQASQHMVGGFSANQKAAQAAKFSSSHQDYTVSLEHFDYLIEVNRLAIQEMQNYLEEMIHPMDDSERLSVPCYGENQKIVAGILRDFRFRLAQFESARAVAQAGADKSAGRQGTITNSLGSRIASGSRKGLGAGAPIRSGPGGRSPASASDITGIKEDQRKAQPGVAP